MIDLYFRYSKLGVLGQWGITWVLLGSKRWENVLNNSCVYFHENLGGIYLDRLLPYSIIS